MPSKTFERYDVVVVPYTFTDKTTVKRRPAVVLSGAEAFNTQSKHLVLAMITSATAHRWPLDVPIVNLEKAGLNVECAVRFKLFTLDERLVLRKAGALSAGDRKAVAAAARKLFVS